MSAGNARHVLVCVAWPYANNSLHLGHVAGSLLAPDIFARFNRMRGNHVLMVSGSDEHGTPITVTADKEGVEPAVVADRFHKEHVENLKALGMSFDLFFRTSDPFHTEVVHEVFNVLLEKGHIYEKEMEALFCGKCDRFLPDRYVEGTCPECGAVGARGDQCDECRKTIDAVELKDPACKLCGSMPEVRSTRHFFFRLSAFNGELLEWLKDKDHWRPNTLKFTLNWLRDGLMDRPITRDLKWGVKVPLDGYDEKRIYVWFEAVIGYLSTSRKWSLDTGDPDAWKIWWQDKDSRCYCFLGKDNIPFHTIIFPAMLMGYGGLNLPYDVPANEYLTMKGEKLSKSRGVMMPVPYCLEKLDADVIRFALTAGMPENHDTDFHYGEIVRRNNEELVSTFGNLVNRVMLFTWKNFGGVPPVDRPLDERDEGLVRAIADHHARMTGNLEACRFSQALKEMMALAQAGNQYMNDAAPWKLVKEDRASASTVMHLCCRLVRSLAVICQPIIPFSASKIWDMLKEKGDIAKVSWDEALDDIGVRDVPKPEPLFKKLEMDMFEPDETPFQSLMLKVGKVIEAGLHPEADKLFVLKVDVGEKEPRQIVTGLRDFYELAELQDRVAIFLLNLKKAKLRGLESQGMILAAEDKNDVSILVPEGEPAIGTVVTADGKGPGETSGKVLSLEDFKGIPLFVGSVDGKKVAVFRDGETEYVLRTEKGDIVPLRDMPDGSTIH